MVWIGNGTWCCSELMLEEREKVCEGFMYLRVGEGVVIDKNDL